MALSVEQFKKLHDGEVTEIKDATSRFTHEFKCKCGVEGKFYSKEDAEKYRQFHFDRKQMRPF